MSYLVGEIGLVGGLLQTVDIDVDWEPWILLGLAASILIYLAFLGTKRAATSSLYLISFPAIAVWILVARTIGGFRFLSVTARALDSLLLKGANWLLLVLACSIVIKTERSIPIIAALIYMGLGATYVIASNFLWVTRPVPYVFRFLDWADDKLRSVLLSFGARFSGAFFLYRQAVSGHREKSPEQARKLTDLLSTADSYVSGARFVKNHLRTIVSPAVLFYLFTLRFLLTTALLLTLFAAAYLAASKLTPGAFGGNRGLPGFGEALYFSTTNFFTVNFGDIVPVSTLARGLITIQVLTGLTMLTLLLLSFSTVSMQVATTTTERFEAKADAIIKEVTSIIGEHYEVQRDFENAIAQIRKDPSLKWLKR